MLGSEVKAASLGLIDELIKLKQEWEDLVDIASINEMEDFARKVVSIGNRFDYSLISDYGNNLLEKVEMFDSEGMSFLMKKFSDLISGIVSGKK